MSKVTPLDKDKRMVLAEARHELKFSTYQLEAAVKTIRRTGVEDWSIMDTLKEARDKIRQAQSQIDNALLWNEVKQ